MADYIKKEHALNHPFANSNFDKTNVNMNFINGIKSYQEYIDLLPPVDAVEVVRCKDCVYWQDEKILMDNNEYRDYLPDEKPYVTLDKGINVGSYCTLHDLEDMSLSWFWAKANDFCSRGVKKNDSY